MANLYVPRRQERELRRFIDDDAPHKPVLLLDGARQVGKTTLVETVLDRCAGDSVRIDLERDSRFRSAMDEGNGLTFPSMVGKGPMGFLHVQRSFTTNGALYAFSDCGGA